MAQEGPDMSAKDELAKGLTRENVYALRWAHSDYGDLTRWCGWDRFAAANPHHPLVSTQRRLKAAETLLEIVLDATDSAVLGNDEED
jgi:hypothetical protein